MVAAELLRRLRNDLPMAVTITALGRDGPPSKMRDGRFVFLCPHCGDMLAHVNPRNNLAHCFWLRQELQQHRPAARPRSRLPVGRDTPRGLVEPVPGPTIKEQNSSSTIVLTHDWLRSSSGGANRIIACGSSRIPNSSVIKPLSATNPYSLNLVTNATTIRPGTGYTPAEIVAETGVPRADRLPGPGTGSDVLAVVV